MSGPYSLGLSVKNVLSQYGASWLNSFSKYLETAPSLLHK